MTVTSDAVELATIAARAADEKLAHDVVVLDVSEHLVITDCFVIASAPNERQVNAIVDNVEERLRQAGHKPVRREGTREGRWTLLDYVDVVVHVQHNDDRDFYALERLWRDCPAVPVDGLGRHTADDSETAGNGDETGNDPETGSGSKFAGDDGALSGSDFETAGDDSGSTADGAHA